MPKSGAPTTAKPKPPAESRRYGHPPFGHTTAEEWGTRNSKNRRLEASATTTHDGED
jgi:hypothetical protein